LSSHPEQQRAQRAAARLAEQDRHSTARVRLTGLRTRRRRALMSGHLTEWFRLRSAVRDARRQVPAVTPAAHSRPSDAEEALAAGQRGEDLVAAQLADMLNGDWVLFRGYRGARGEIDGVLAGPGGVVAIEVKAYNGVIYVDGDTWLREKYDNYGNRLGVEALGGAGRRSPSVQLNAAADALQDFLRRFGQPVPVRRVVVLAHHKARVRAARALTVDGVGTSAKVVTDVFKRSTSALDPAAQAEIARLIERDHNHHERRRTQR
jgi:hypothetical protein